MSRISSIFDDADGVLDGGEDINASYKYLGTGTIVEEDYEDIEVKLSYLDGAGDITGFDRFGRVAEQIWTDYGADPNEAIDHYTYTYDRAGNRISRDNELNGTLDESYTYDNLDRLASWSLNGVLQKSWADLDGLGNDLATGTYNAANEMTPTVGSSGYDAAGNMTTLQSGDTAVYDAWNRMVEVNDGQDIIQQNEYDSTHRRIQIFSDFTGATPGATQDDYYTSQQIIETHEDSAVKYQNIWSPRYIDSLIIRDTISAGQIVTADRIFYLADANFNVTGLVKYNSGTSDWEVAERYTYTPYGVATFRNAAWADVGSSANENATLYTGRYLDLLTSLYYYRARYYDATLERFISRDPIGYKGGDVNLYRYVFNNPLMFTDPFGEQSAGAHHPYPLHLGGCMGQDLIQLTATQHVEVHKFLRLRGWGTGDVSRAAWAKLSFCEQKALIAASLRHAKVPVGAIRQVMSRAMACARPGVKTPRTGKPGKIIKGVGIIGIIVAICCSDDAEGAIVDTCHPVNIVFGGCSTMGDGEFHYPPPLVRGPELFYEPVRPNWKTERGPYRTARPFPPKSPSDLRWFWPNPPTF